MQRGLLRYATLLLMIAGSFSACQKYPIEISDMREHSYTRSRRYNLWKDTPIEGVIIINSDTELHSLFLRPNVNFYGGDSVDFSKNSLLLTGGCSLTQVERVEGTLSQLAKEDYILDIFVYPTLIPITPLSASWSAIFVVPKMSDNVSITLRRTFMEIEGDIMYTAINHPPEGTSDLDDSDYADIDMSEIDFSNIEDLIDQPIPVIQKCIQGRWKWLTDPNSILYDWYANVYIEITEDQIVITGDCDTVQAGFYTWKKWEGSGPGVAGNGRYYIMWWYTNLMREYWYFVGMKGDTLWAKSFYGGVTDRFSFERVK